MWPDDPPEVDTVQNLAPPGRGRRGSVVSQLRLVVAVLAVAVVGLGVLAWSLHTRISELESGDTSAAGDGVSATEDLFDEPDDLEGFIRTISKSVVTVYCNGNGTGFAYDMDGLDAGYKTFIVTNHHVIEDCIDDPSGLSVTYGGEVENPAKVILSSWDAENDLALLQIDVLLTTLTDAANFARPGEWTMAIGNPGPDDEILHNATTFGRIIAVENKYWNYTSAVINPGNSGGPLVNSRGELIGINSLHMVNEDDGLWNIAIDSVILCEKIVDCT